MTELIEQIQRYTQALADPAAVGADPAEGHYAAPDVADRPGRKVLAACLALVVLVAAGGLIVASRQRASTPVAASSAVTVTGGNADLEVRVETNGADIPFGSTLSVHTELTNLSDQPMRVLPRAEFSVQLVWDQPGASASEVLSATNDFIPLFALFAAGDFRSTNPTPVDGYADGDLVESVVLDPGGSVSYDGTLAVDAAVRPGAGLVVVTPDVFVPNPDPAAVQGDYVGPDGAYVAAGPMKDAAVVVPVNIGEPADSSLTKPEAMAVAIADPQIAGWSAAVYSPSVTGSVYPNLYRIGHGWTLTVGPSGLEGESAIKQSGKPGLIATITDDGTVTIDWISFPPEN